MQISGTDIQGIASKVFSVFKGIVCKLWWFDSVNEKLHGTCKTWDRYTTIMIMMMMVIVNIYGMFSITIYKAPLQIVYVNIAL